MHPLIATIHLIGVNIEHVVYTLRIQFLKCTGYIFLGVDIHPCFNSVLVLASSCDCVCGCGSSRLNGK